MCPGVRTPRFDLSSLTTGRHLERTLVGSDYLHLPTRAACRGSDPRQGTGRQSVNCKDKCDCAPVDIPVSEAGVGIFCDLDNVHSLGLTKVVGQRGFSVMSLHQ